MNAWIQYSLLRFAMFAGVLAILLLLGVDWLLSAIIAALIGVSASYIFLRSQREAVAEDLAKRVRTPKARRDADADEDDALDRRE